MKRIFRGDSTDEMADILKISEVTVNQYIKSAIKKMKQRGFALLLYDRILDRF